MIIVIMGESGSGKSTMALRLEQLGYVKIINTTTRLHRYGERNGNDYHFVSKTIFEEKIQCGKMLEWDLYSQDRYYGIALEDIPNEKDSVVVLTPNGYRALKKIKGDEVVGIYLKASLGNRMIRYIRRCGVNEFNFDDKNELAARVERDYGMFLGIDKEVDMVIDANGDDLYTFGLIRTELEKRGSVNGMVWKND